MSGRASAVVHLSQEFASLCVNETLPDHVGRLDDMTHHLEIFGKRVEEMAILLQQLRSLMDCVEEQVIPQLLAKAAFVQQLFQKVDRLEEFVEQVEAEVQRIEKLIDEAEERVLLPSGKTAIRMLDKAFSFVGEVSSITQRIATATQGIAPIGSAEKKTGESIFGDQRPNRYQLNFPVLTEDDRREEF
eukprot:TRINITY_DN14415_c0_g1_i6.p1 TRINITY_DN14415_c0_g1~~TRINITY_DN14415_c0_g1_i6.p1  ORF type:complete len:188 (+),score=47.16 TRINITY_DN14415_c0_g1_i6:52-615(+)